MLKKTSLSYWKIHLGWYRLAAWFKYHPHLNYITARYFVKIAWRSLRGKILIIETKNAISNGGFKYVAIIVSKSPVSNSHTYEEY